MITPPDADSSPPPSRYYAADFHKLTNRRSSSPLTPDFSAPDRALPARATENQRSVVTSDTRTQAFSNFHAVPCVAQVAGSNFRLRQGSVKEETNGEITRMGFWQFSHFAPIVTKLFNSAFLQSPIADNPPCVQA